MRTIVFVAMFCFCSGLVCGWAPVFREDVSSRLAEAILKDETYVGYCERGIKKLDRGDYSAAILDFNQSIRLNPRHGRAFHNRGNAEEYLHDYKSALRDFARAIELNYQNAYYNRAALRSKLGDKRGAVADLTQCILHKNLLIDSHACRGWELELLGDKKAAMDDFLYVQKSKPVEASEFGNRAWVLAHLGDHIGAIKDFDLALKLNPESSWAFDKRGLSKQALGNSVGAVQDFEEAVRLSPHFAFAHYDLGAERLNSHDYRSALSEFNRAIACDSDVAIFYSGRAVAYAHLEKLQAAKADYLKRLKLDPANPSHPLQWLAETQFELGEFREALVTYNKAIFADPKKACLWAHRGRCKSALKDDTGGLSDFNRAIGIDPNYSWAYQCRAIANENLNDKKGALSDYNECIRLDKNAMHAYIYRAHLRAELGDPHGACDDYCSAIQTGAPAIPLVIQSLFQ